MDIIQQLLPLEKECKQRGIPLISQEKARFILELIKKHNPHTILELGTANGYSGIILASHGAALTTIELKPSVAQEALQNFKQHNISAKVIIGDALTILPQLKEEHQSYDLIFMDFPKKKYLSALEYCLQLLNPHGFLLIDNISEPDCRDCKEALLRNTSLNTIFACNDDLGCSQKIR